jgi:hypothetical protein
MCPCCMSVRATTSSDRVVRRQLAKNRLSLNPGREVAFGKTRVNFERLPAVEFSFLEPHAGVFGDQDHKLTPEQESPSRAGSEGI